MSVTASLGSFSFMLTRDLCEALFLLGRLEAVRFALRLAIMAGIVLQLGKTTSMKNGSETRHSWGRAGGQTPLFFRELATCVQAIEMENGVEHHGIGAAGLAAIDRVS